jgi:phosphoribosylformimino-5-aminoimidazole carboxamide ribonucleotide (ProFAR) isomerase
LATTIPVIASGGVASLDDVRILATIPALAGVITGKAIYEGRFTVEQAVAALSDVNLGSGGAQ